MVTGSKVQVWMQNKIWHWSQAGCHVFWPHVVKWKEECWLTWSCWWVMFIYLLSLNERNCQNTSVDSFSKAIFLVSETLVMFWVNAFNNQHNRFCLQTSLNLNVLKMKSKTDRHFGSNLTSLWHKFQHGYGTEYQIVSTCNCSNYVGHVVSYYFQYLF